MAETDPFGREKSEDPLAAMGWSGQSGGTEGAAAEIAPPASGYRPSGSTGTSGGIPGQGRKSRGGCIVTTIVLIFVLAFAGVIVPAVIDAIDTVGERIDEFTPTIPEATEDRPGGSGNGNGGGREARPPKALERASMLRRGNLAPALRRLQRITNSSRVRLIRIDAQNVIVQTAASGGRTRLAQATWKGDAAVLSTSPGGGASTFSWSQVEASAPNRVVRAATRGRGSSSFDYLVLIDAAGLRWSAFLKAGRGTFQADPDGGNVRKIG